MGDMADYFVSRMLDRGMGYGSKRRKSVYGPPVVCKHCDDKDVYWQNVGGVYKLHNKGDLSAHNCFPAPTPDGFEDEPV